MSSRKERTDDERFCRVQKDPRFWEMPEKERKVKIDKRFQSMFHDRRFQTKQTVDKRGRPVQLSTAADLRRFYQLEEEEEEEEEEKEAEEDVQVQGQKKHLGRGSRAAAEDDDEEEHQSGDDDDDDDDEESGLDSDDDSGPDLARGKGNMETSSDEDEDDDDVDDILRQEEEQIEHDWGELCRDAPRSQQVSARLAVCNMDWDRLKAKDLLALFSSFVPEGGAVLSVKIFPSEFGKERLKVEETQGPPELKALPDDSENETEEDRVYREKLRDYQFKRLKYFYAVVECDSVETAVKIYEECDGFEYESSCSVLDLRFVPDDVTFDEEPSDVATDINLTAYTPKLFTSSAVASSKVQLTWDETDHERVTALNRKFNKEELLDLDFKAYLASSSEEDEDEEQEAGGEETIGEEVEEKPQEKQKKKKRSEEQISKYRELLKSIQSKEKRQQEDVEMEISWVPGLKETAERLVKKKLEAKDQMTPWEEFLQKKKQKKKQKKSERKQGAEEELSDDELPPDVDLSDPFFSDELGPSDMKKKQKKKKQEEEQLTAEEEEERQKQKAQMALLMEDDDDEAKHKHFNYDKIVEQQNLSRRKRKKLLRKGEAPLEDDGFQVDVSDPRFQAVFTSHLFNLDPSHPGFRNTRATQSILEEKQRRRRAEPGGGQEGAEPGGGQEAAGTVRESDSKKAMDPSLSLLVKSIKSKTEQFQARKKRRVT